MTPDGSGSAISGCADRGSSGVPFPPSWDAALHEPRAGLWHPRDVDHRTDVYGCHALRAVRPQRPALRGTTIRLEALAEDRRGGSRGPPRRIDPAIPRDLETIVRKAMARDLVDGTQPPASWPTTGWSPGNRPIVPRPPRAIDHATKWSRRHRPAVAAAVIVLLAVVAGVVGAVVWRTASCAATTTS